MMKIINIGMNHETAPVELRECLAAEPENTVKALSSMRDLQCIGEGLFLSTCNRVETLFTSETGGEARVSIISLMSRLGNIPAEDFLPSLYMFEDGNAVSHIFRVASSLDSMVIGEPQILGQIKDAYATAARERTSGVILNRLMHRAFHAAKRVRTETGVCDAAVSISYAAVELAKKIFHELNGKKVLLIGAGEMAELAAKNLMAQGVISLVCFEEIEDQLLEADIVVTSTASPEYVITYDQVKKLRRKRRSRSLFFLDIAVPRDVEPGVNDLENVYLYDIDDLKGVVRLNMTQRRKEAVKAERIIQEEVIKFEKWRKTLAVVPTIISLKYKAESIIEAELKRSGYALGELTPTQDETIQTLVRSIAEKVLNDPILYLKGRAGRLTLNNDLDVTRKLFNLDRDPHTPPDVR
jgi:glutamyl-tRNA reductase